MDVEGICCGQIHDSILDFAEGAKKECEKLQSA